MEQDQISQSEQEWVEVGARLRAARELAGLSQENAADLIRIGRPTLSAMEAGRTKVHSLLLRSFATLYRQEFGYFLGRLSEPSQPDRTLSAQLGDLGPRDRAVVSSFLEFCSNVARLNELANRPRRALPAARPFQNGARKYVAEAEAEQERARLGLGDSPIGERIFDLLDVVGLPVYRTPLEDPGLSGLLVYHASAGPVMFVNSAQHPWRQAFTAAHEYGHFLFYRSQQPVVCRVFAAERLGSEKPASEKIASETVEEFVNAFASEFLMPEAGIKRFLVAIGAGTRPLEARDVAQLQRHFGVSFDAVLFRLLRLRLIRDNDVQNIRAMDRSLVPAWSWRRGAEGTKGDESEGDELDLWRKFPSSFIDLVLEALEKDWVSSGRAAELFELNRGAFDRFSRQRRLASEAAQSEQGIEYVVA